MADIASFLEDLPESVFAQVRGKILNLSKKAYRFHIGDTYIHPEICPVPKPLQERFLRYGIAGGYPEFLNHLLTSCKERYEIELEKKQFQISVGATGGLSLVVQSFCEPGDELMVMTPYWPLIAGIIQGRGGNLKEVEYTTDADSPDLDLLERCLEEAFSDRTKALYFSHPNNPDGYTYKKEELELMARFCREKDLWMVSDEAYHEYFYEPQEPFVSALELEDRERLIVTRTFSKSHGLAGLRCGYIISPCELSSTIARLSNYQVYNVSDGIQWQVLEVLKEGTFPQKARESYRRARTQAYQILAPWCPKNYPFGAYLWLDFQDPDRSWKIFEKLLEKEIVVAPGIAFGSQMGRFLRFCFTGEPPERVREGAEKIADLLR